MKTEQNQIQVWITKWALTIGIFSESVVIDDEYPGMIKTKHGYVHGVGRDWHTSIESAKAQAERVRVKKIASLKKQIAKLEDMRF